MSAALAALFFCFGAVLASFAGVVAERMHTGQSWLHGRSRCNACGRGLGFPDLVPVFSWAAHRGRCRTCRARIPGTYAAAEFALGLSFLFAYRTAGLSVALGLLLLGLFLLAVVVLYDLRHMIVPPAFAIALIVCSAGYAYVAYGPAALPRIGLVAAAIAVAFLILHYASKGRVMGLGDAPIAFGLSLLAGPNALSGLVFSFWIGAAIGIIVLFRHPKGHRMGIEVPFVPFLALGYLLALFTQWNVFPPLF